MTRVSVYEPQEEDPVDVRELLNVLDLAVMLGETDWRKLMAEHRAINAGLLTAAPTTSPTAASAETVSSKQPLVAPDQAAKASAGVGSGQTETLDAVVRGHVREVHEACGGNLTKAAEILGVSRNTVRKHLRPFG